MASRTFTREEFFDLLDDAKEVGHENWRHGHKTTYVLTVGDEFYRVTMDVHHEDGIQFYGDTITAERVRPVEKTVTAWEKWKP